jgi:hypothetical protein
VRLADLE